MSTAFPSLPSSADKSRISSLDITKAIPADKIELFQTLAKLSPLGPETWENSHCGRKYGTTLAWLRTARQTWVDEFKWEEHGQKHIETFPQWVASVAGDKEGEKMDVHFTGLFSTRADAVPVLFLHGWPGCFLEFYGVLQHFAKAYTPETLPYHLIVPSQPGYAFSSGPPLDRDYTVPDAAHLMHRLMVALGFEKSGYITQGGDVGSAVARLMAVFYPQSCKAYHLNFDIVQKPPTDLAADAISPAEGQALQRLGEWQKNGLSYAMMQGTRPATIGLALSTSPVALLAWLGEKYLAWTDADPPLMDILRTTALYWLTDAYPRGIYPYRMYVAMIQAAQFPPPPSEQPQEMPKAQQPFGYSWFPHELTPTPIAWVATNGNLVWHRSHTAGGHFAAWERPEIFSKDIEDFVKQVWKRDGAGLEEQTSDLKL